MRPWRFASASGLLSPGKLFSKYRVDRVAELELLYNVVEEVDANLTWIEGALPSNTNRQRLLLRLADVIAGVPSKASNEAAEELLAGLFGSIPYPQLSTVALEAVVAPGNLRLVRDAELRRSLSELEATIAVARSVYASERECVENFIRPYALENVQVFDLEGWWEDSGLQVPRSRFDSGIEALRSDAYIENFVAYRLLKLRDTGAQLDRTHRPLV